MRYKFIVFIFVMLLGVNSVTALLGNGLIGYFPFDNNANDIISGTIATTYGSNNSIIHLNSTNSSRCKNGNCYFFNSASSSQTRYINYSNPSYINVGEYNSSYTICLWLNRNNTGSVADQVFFNTYYATSLYGLQLSDDGTDKYRYDFGNSTIGTLTGTVTLRNGVWTLVCMNRNQTKYSLYINGSVEVTATKGNADTRSNYSMLLGNDLSFAHGVTGMLDNLYVWNRSLTSSEISTLWGSGNGYNISYLTIVTPSMNSSVYTLNNTIPLTYSVFNLTVGNCTYSLDNGAVTSITDCSNISLTNVSYGTHTVIVYFNSSTDNFSTSSTFNVYQVNTTFTFYDEDTLVQLNNVNVTIMSDTNQTNYSTTTGIVQTSLLTIGNYTLRANASGYDIRMDTININSTLALFDIYLTGTPPAYSTLFTVKDKDAGTIIPDALIIMYRFINGAWVAVESHYSDITGKVAFDYSANVNYKFMVSVNTYNTSIFYLNPILFSTYDISLAKSVLVNYSSDYSGIAIAYTPYLFNNNAYNTFNFIIGSGSSDLINYGYNITYPWGSIVNSSNNPLGSQLSSLFLVSGANVTDTVVITYYYNTTLTGVRTFTAILPIYVNSTSFNNTIASNKNKTYGLGDFERILIITISVIIIIGIAAMLGQILPGFVLGIFMFGYAAYIGFISWWAIWIVIIIGLMYMTWKSGAY